MIDSIGCLSGAGGWGLGSPYEQPSPTTNSWDLISNMPTGRYDCLVAVLPTNEMMVVGGNDTIFTTMDKVEVARFSLS